MLRNTSNCSLILPKIFKKATAMLDKASIANPYARAVFEQARQNNSLESWSVTLNLAANIVQDPTMREIIHNPLISSKQIVDIILNAVQDQFSDEACNFIRVLATNNRISVLPEIAMLYEKQRADLENRLEAEIISAFPMDAMQERIMTQALEKRFGRTIHTTIQVDQNLIGGAIVRVGDVVIDGSLRAGLTQMANELRI